MGDSALSREYLSALARRCNTDLDRDIMVYVARGKERVILLAINRWKAFIVGSTQVLRHGWDRATHHDKRRVMSDLIRRVQTNGQNGTADPVLPRDFVTRFPAIAEFLTAGHYPDGGVRKRSAITLMAGDGEGFKAVLNDPDNCRGLWATAATAEGLFVALEALAGDPRAPWKPSKPLGSRKGA